jgi:hypothetical protein
VAVYSTTKSHASKKPPDGRRLFRVGLLEIVDIGGFVLAFLVGAFVACSVV